MPCPCIHVDAHLSFEQLRRVLRYLNEVIGFHVSAIGNQTYRAIFCTAFFSGTINVYLTVKLCPRFEIYDIF